MKIYQKLLTTMNKFEKYRADTQKALDAEINQLEQLNPDNFWELIKDVYQRYNEKFAEIDAAERSAAAIAAGSSTAEARPERQYADVVNQLRAQKQSELLTILAALSSNTSNKSDADSSLEPFYQDNQSPLDYFNYIFDNKLKELPSVSELREFLSHITINNCSQLCWNGKCSVSESGELNESIQGDVNLLDRGVFRSRQAGKAELRQMKIDKLKQRAPLMRNNAAWLQSQVKKTSASARALSSSQDTIVSLIESYGLSPRVADLLIDHALKVATVKGLLHIDEYNNMLSRFLRAVETDDERCKIITTAIEKNWRILSDGSY